MSFLWLILSLAVVGADKLVKYLVSGNMSVGGSFELIPGVIAITYVQNTGVSFSMFDDSPTAMVVVTGIAIAVCAVIIFFLFYNKYKSNLFNAALALILAGALGNVIDRVQNGYVVDMFEFLFVRFAIFNIADISLTVGTVLFAVWILRSERGVNNIQENTM
ncbi:MAG: signal peptidase II [Oscillospiraceae bacterium]|jgi:signal peptidase II|nr:signal peptidase II [Oscillospiraceae bacterium]